MDNRQHSKKSKSISTKEFRSKIWADLLDPIKAWQRAISGAFAPNYYQGTVPDKVKSRRRAKNKVARKSRRINRQRAKR